MDFENIIFEKEGAIARITLNRPQKLNAMSRALLREFDAAIADIRADHAMRVVVIKGAGRAFCAGFDLTDPEAEGHEGMTPSDIIQEERESGIRSMDRWYRLWDLPQVVIAQVHGYALAGGCELAMVSDLTVVAEDAVIGYPVSRMGVSPRHILPWVVGLKKSKELLFTGDSVKGKEAVSIGMANQAYPADKLEAEVNKLAKKIAEMPLELISLHKALINRTFEFMGLKNSVNYGLELHAFGHITEAREGFDKMVKEKGLKKAVAERDTPFTSKK